MASLWWFCCTESLGVVARKDGVREGCADRPRLLPNEGRFEEIGFGNCDKIYNIMPLNDLLITG